MNFPLAYVIASCAKKKNFLKVLIAEWKELMADPCYGTTRLRMYKSYDFADGKELVVFSVTPFKIDQNKNRSIE